MDQLLLDNIAPLFGLCFLALLNARSKTFDTRRRRLLYLALFVELAELVAANVEMELALISYHSLWRDLASAIGYTTRPLILMIIILMMAPKKRTTLQNTLLYTPFIIATVLGFSVFFTNVAYFFTPDNIFVRGPLGLVPIFCVVAYLLMIAVLPSQKSLSPYFDHALLLLIVAYIGASMIAESFFGAQNVGRTAIVYSTIFFFYLIQASMLQKALHAERENKTLKTALHDADVARAKLLESQRALLAAKTEADRANAVKTGFLHRMSHDMRTPLNGILGLIEISKAHPEDRELATRNRNKVEVAAKHLLSLVNDVLQTSKLEDGALKIDHKPLDIVHMTQEINDIMEGRAIESEIAMINEPNEEIVKYRYVYGSELHLRQILLNVYSNCIKYNRADGKVFTKIDVVKDDDSHVTYRWEIRDTGIGMSPEFLEHVFDLFAQESDDARSSYMGTGLGMPIAKNLTELMGGSITVESEQNVGSTFVITIPFELADAPIQHSDIANEEAGIQGLRILLAEDNELNAEVAQVLLEDAGAQVTVVDNGKKAVEAFESAPQGCFDAVLMDLMMPVMNGIDATKAIRSLRHPDACRIPIIAMTANAFKEDEEACLAAGMNAHLAKPFEMSKVKQTLAVCVAEAREM